MSATDLARGAAKNFNRHTPMFLAIVGSVGVAATAYLAHQAGFKAAQRIAHEERVDEKFEETPMTTKEKVDLNWKLYLFPLSVGIATVACVVTSNVISQKRQAALIGAYALGERAFSQYKDKMIDTLGLDTEKDITEDLAKDKAAASAAKYYSENEIPLLDGKKAMFIDTFSGQMFITELETVYKAQEHVNRKCAEEGYASMNYFYSYLGVRRSEIGEIMGWNTDRMMDLVVARVNHEDEDSMNIYGIDYMEQPMMEYHRVV